MSKSNGIDFFFYLDLRVIRSTSKGGEGASDRGGSDQFRNSFFILPLPRYLAIVTSKVLDEGVDVPDAKLGIIVSGTGSGREFIQRLGRLLRPKKDISDTYEQAKLIEIISSNTREAGTSAKRKNALMKINRKEKMRDEAKESCY